jgi:hypothetical protein
LWSHAAITLPLLWLKSSLFLATRKCVAWATVWAGLRAWLPNFNFSMTHFINGICNTPTAYLGTVYTVSAVVRPWVSSGALILTKKDGKRCKGTLDCRLEKMEPLWFTRVNFMVTPTIPLLHSLFYSNTYTVHISRLL